MSFEVMLTHDSARDLEEIYNYIAANDMPARADHVIEKIQQVFTGLSEFPQQGAFPKELLKIGIREYREVFFKPYRIIYRIINSRVYVMLIVDGRRDIQAVLQRRLLQE
ncbi:MAG: type II toxin-antitoxin system RelE/ParE family toxin [Desulfobacterales bacterium]